MAHPPRPGHASSLAQDPSPRFGPSCSPAQDVGFLAMHPVGGIQAPDNEYEEIRRRTIELNNKMQKSFGLPTLKIGNVRSDSEVNSSRPHKKSKQSVASKDHVLRPPCTKSVHPRQLPVGSTQENQRSHGAINKENLGSFQVEFENEEQHQNGNPLPSSNAGAATSLSCCEMMLVCLSQ